MALLSFSTLAANVVNAAQQQYQRQFTAADNTLVFLFASARSGAGTPNVATITDNVGLSWVTAGTPTVASAIRNMGWYAAVTSGGSYTATVDWGTGGVGACEFVVVQAADYNTGTPVPSSGTRQATGTSTTPNTGTAPALVSSANGRILAAAHARGTAADMTAESGWSKGAEVVNASPAVGLGVTWLLPGTDDTTPTMTLGSSVAWAAMSIEVGGASSGVVGTSTALRQGRRRRR